MTRLTLVIGWILNPIKSLHLKLAALLVSTLIILNSNWASAQDNPGLDNSSGEPTTIHVVLVDESIDTIAAAYDIEVDELRAANDLAPYETVFPGLVLNIPVQPVSITTQIDVGFTDTFQGIATQYFQTPEQMGQLNELVNPEQIYTGQVLALGARSQTLPSSLSTGLSQITAERPFWKVALQSGQSVAAVALMNQVVNPVTAAPGQYLVVRGNSTDASTASPPWLSVSATPDWFAQGRTNTIRVRADQDGVVSGSFLDAELRFVREASGDWVALVPVARFQTPGRFPFTLTFTSSDGATFEYSRDVVVLEGNYALEGIFISEEVLDALRDEQAVTEEVIYIRAIMSGFEEEKRWEDGLWFLPAPGIMSSGFGSNRIYNQGDLTSWHPGSDLAAPIGTPIYAPARGVVIDTANLEVRGLVTIINHGRGVYTGYWHQQNIFVEPGEVVETGQLIGEIGNTGLSTAAHLHWEMHVNGIPVEPLQWVREERR